MKSIVNFTITLSIAFTILLVKSQNAICQNLVSYSNGEAYAFKTKEGETVMKKPVGLKATLTYNTFYKSYHITWVKEDNSVAEVHLEFVRDDADCKCAIMKETNEGRGYFTDTEQLNAKGIFVAMQISERSDGTRGGIGLSNLVKK